MEIEIREAKIDDLAKVQELNLKLFEKECEEWDSLLDLNWTFSEVGTKYFTGRISNDEGCVLVAVVSGEIIAYLCGGLIESEEYRKLPIVAELENTFVLDEFRSRGIGGKIYDKFVEWCKGKNVGKIRVEAAAQNELAINFYRKNNFKDYTLVLEADL